MTTSKNFSGPRALIVEVKSGLEAYGMVTYKSFNLGVYALPEQVFFSTHANPADVKEGSTTFYELTRFRKMGVLGYPRVLETLFCRESDIVKSSPAFDVLRQGRNLFLTKKAAMGVKDMAERMFESFMDSVNIEASISGKWYHQKIKYNGASASNAVRLARMVNEILRGEVLIYRPDAEELNSILRQGVAKGLIIEAFKKEAEQFEKNFQESKLPEDVNQEAMSLLIESVYKKAWHNNAAQKNTPARKKTQSNSHHNDLGGHSLAAA